MILVFLISRINTGPLNQQITSTGNKVSCVDESKQIKINSQDNSLDRKLENNADKINLLNRITSDKEEQIFKRKIVFQNDSAVKNIKIVEFKRFHNDNESSDEVLSNEKFIFDVNEKSEICFKQEESINYDSHDFLNIIDPSSSDDVYRTTDEEKNLNFINRPNKKSICDSSKTKINAGASKSKDSLVFNTLVDNVDNFKDSDVESLCSSRVHDECMNACFSCGEVFLMKSSLAQHYKTYHGDISA